MATSKTVELPVRVVLDDEDRRRIRACANALTKASGVLAELGETFAALADGGNVLPDTQAAVTKEPDSRYDYGDYAVGQRVTVVDEDHGGDNNGRNGNVVRIDPSQLWPIQVHLDGHGHANQFRAGELRHKVEAS